MAPSTCAAIYRPASSFEIFFRITITKVTAGLKCAPLVFIPTLITTAKPIAVAKALINNLTPPS